MIGIALASVGFLSPTLAAFIHVTSELVFILNSARVCHCHVRSKKSRSKKCQAWHQKSHSEGGVEMKQSSSADCLRSDLTHSSQLETEVAMVSSIGRIKEQKQAIIQANNVKASTQVLTILPSLALLWWVALRSIDVSHWLAVAAVLLITLFTVRAFALMHECGHGSLFGTQWLNRTFGFLLGAFPACRSTCGRSSRIITMLTTAIGINIADCTPLCLSMNMRR
jgi:hypothetical protein